MTILNRITLAALLLSTATTFAEAPNNDTDTIASSDIATLAGADANNFNLLTQNFFVQPLLVSDDVRNIAFAMLEVAFGKWNKKEEVIFCTYNHFQNKATTTKYKNVEGVLSPIKSEEYTGPADGSPNITKNVRKGRTARSTIAAQEGAARLLRAATKPEDITQVSLVELYNNCIPLCMQVDSTVQATQFIAYAQAQLAQAAIDPSVRAQELKPLCVLIVSGDHLLKTIDESQWAALQSMYNMTTLYDVEVRKHVLEMRKALCDMVKDAKDGLDLNPSFLEGLFDDLSSNNYNFNYKKIAREVISNVFSLKGVVGMAAGIAFYKWFIHEHVINATSKGWDKVRGMWTDVAKEKADAKKAAFEAKVEEKVKLKKEVAAKMTTK